MTKRTANSKPDFVSPEELFLDDDLFQRSNTWANDEQAVLVLQKHVMDFCFRSLAAASLEKRKWWADVCERYNLNPHDSYGLSGRVILRRMEKDGK